jgi:hypothetical protein
MKPICRTALVALVAVTVSGSGLALGQGRGGRGTPTNQAAGTVSTIERIIRDWFGDSHNLAGLPPGLAKRESLPPGLDRQLRERGQLPPGLERHIHDLPPDLVLRLPVEKNRRWIMIGGNVILLDETTSLIVDIIEAVF